MISFFALSMHRAIMALLDIPINGLTALFVVAPLILRPFRPRLALLALAAGILLDLDHAVAARSIHLEDMLSLQARPIAHSLGFVVLASLLAGLIARRVVVGWVVIAALSSHLMRDMALGGVRLYYPAEGVSRIPYPSYLAGLLLLLLISFVIRGISAKRAVQSSADRA